MDPISMALGAGMVGNVGRVVAESGSKMTDLAEKMLKTGLEIRLAGREMGKGQLLDLVA